MDLGEMLNLRIEAIALHRHAHNDELLAAYILQTFGGVSYFPGANTAKIVFWDCIPVGRTWEDLLVKDRTIVIGMGFGPFDEHLPTGGRKPGHCAATLVAEALSLDDDSILKPLLKFTLSRDIEQGGGSFELPALIKALWASDTGGIDRDQVVLAWAFSIYGAMYQRGANFSEGTIQDYQNAGKVTIKDDSGRRINFVYGHSDSSEFGKFARYKKAGIVLWMKSGGNVIIQTDRRLNIELAPVVRAIRIAEMCEQYRLKPSQAPFPLTASQGCAEGTIDECPAWFFHENARAIMNGLESHAVAPTLLSLERLANIIQAVLHKNPPRRVSFPQKGRVFVRLAGVRPSPILMPQTAEAISTDVISVEEQPLGSEMLQ